VVGKTLGHYEILEPLGAGGMGEVYRARDSMLRRDVAVKVLPEDLADDPDRLARLEREAHLLAAINHPNIATIHALEEHGGARFLVLELVKGESLEQLLARGPVPTEKALALCRQIAAALEAAHNEGIVHRDLKPANVLVTLDGRAKVLDFGIATNVGVGADVSETAQGTNLTVAGTLIGTPAYMSPEQVRGEAIDKRSDNWAFGCLLYEMLTGKSAFGRETLADILAAVIDQDPDWEALSRAGGGHVESLIRRCLQKDPQQRLRDIGDAWLEIGETLGGDTVVVEPAPSPKQGKTLAAVALAVVLVAAAGIWWQTRPADESPQVVAGGPGTGPGAVSHPTVAVLPFQNLGGDDDLGYLGMAVPDEIISVLSRVETLAVRPFASTASYTSVALDLAEVGATVRAVNLVTGQYFREGDQLTLTMEAVDAESNRILWRDTITVPSSDLLNLRQQVAEKVNGGLVSTIAPAATVSATPTVPSNSEAYELFLRSLALAREPAADAQAVDMLERAVELDPGYARIWDELALRLYFHAHYGGGGVGAYEREEVAIRTALELDPDDLLAAERRVVSLTDDGKVAEALVFADAMVERRADSGIAFFARSYARRYASLIDGAIEDCEMALALDPTNYRWRSCAISFTLNGDYDGSAVFLALDPTSLFSINSTGHLLLSAGEPERAVAAWADMPEGFAYGASLDLVAAVVAGRNDRDIERGVVDVVALSADERDAESIYVFARTLIFAGAMEEGYELVRRAIAQNYCAATGLEKERIWEPYREDPDFLEVLRLARECRDRLSSATG